MKTLITTAKELDDQDMQGKRVLVRIAGRPEMYAEVSRRAVARAFASLATGCATADLEAVQDSVVLDFDAGYRAELEGLIIS